MPNNYHHKKIVKTLTNQILISMLLKKEAHIKNKVLENQSFSKKNPKVFQIKVKKNNLFKYKIFNKVIIMKQMIIISKSKRLK